MNYRQEIETIIKGKLASYREINGVEPIFLLMDDMTYFDLKVALYQSAETAASVEIDEFMGYKVFYNQLGYTYIEFAA